MTAATTLESLPQRDRWLTPLADHLGRTMGWNARPRDLLHLEQAVGERMEELGIDDPFAYRRLVEQAEPADDGELHALVERLTIGETYFFRDAGHMEILRHHVLPRLIGDCAERRLRLWSAGCATGQEVYTLAMLVLETLPEPGTWDIHILGTDVNRRYLARAREGRYGGWALRGLSAARRARWFSAEDGHWVVGEPLRRRVRFEYHNLTGDLPPPMAEADLVLCRNILIYLAPRHFPGIVHRFGRVLAHRGYLMTGHGELMGVPLPGLVPETLPEGTIYRRDREGPAEAAGAVHLPPAPVLPPVPMPTSTPARARPPQSAAGASPRPAPADLARGRAALADGRTDEAVAILERLVNADADAVTPRIDLARALAARGSYAAARRHLEQVLARTPLDHHSHYLLAHLLELEGEPGAAARSLERTLYLKPDFVPACLDLAANAANAGRGDVARRHRAAARRLLASHADDATLWPYDGVTVADLRRYLDAELRAAPSTDQAP